MLDVPPTMPVTRLNAFSLPPSECGAVPFPTSGAFLGNGDSAAFACPMIPAGVVPVPTDGVWIHTAGAPGDLPLVPRIVGQRRLRLAVAALGTEPVLEVQPTSSGGGTFPIVIRVGLGADPAIARTILASIRTAAPAN
jgi:hypothetical protein